MHFPSIQVLFLHHSPLVLLFWTKVSYAVFNSLSYVVLEFTGGSVIGGGIGKFNIKLS